MYRIPKKLAALLLTLVMLVSLAPAAFAADGANKGAYRDVEQTDEYFRAVTALRDKGYMNGIEDDVFGTDSTITRGQAVTILYRMEGEPEVADAVSFTDVESGQYYAEAAAWAAANGILEGYPDGTFKADDPLTDEAANLIAQRYANKYLGGVKLPANLMREFTVNTTTGGNGGPGGGQQGGGAQQGGGQQGGGQQGGGQQGGGQQGGGQQGGGQQGGGQQGGGQQGGGQQGGGQQGGGQQGGGSSEPAAAAPLKRSDYAMGVYELLKLKDNGGSYSIDLNDYMDQWILVTEDAKQNNMGALLVNEDGSFTMYDVEDAYALMGLTYCANPADPYIQTLDIYVPAAYVDAAPNGNGTYTVTFNNKTITNANGTTYDVHSAPIIYQTTIDGYAEGYSVTLFSDLKGTSQNTIKTVETERSAQYDDYIEAGYILVVPSSRGRDSAFVDGTAPAPIVDLKAGVRYLKYNKNVMPGDTDKIIAIGGSAGGSCVALLAASGNSGLYTPYLEEIGAAPAADDIFGVRAMATIANVHLADAAYAYLHYNETSWTGMGPSAGTTTLEGAQVEIHKALKTAFEEYIVSLGFDADTFMNDYTDAINDAINEFVGAYYSDNIDGFFNYEYSNNKGQKNQKLADAYDAATGKFAVKDPIQFVADFMARSKGLLGFDGTGNSTLEAQLFGKTHFSQTNVDVFQKILDAGEYTNYDDSTTLQSLIDAYQKEVDANEKEIKLMSVLTFLVDGEKSDIAPHWHLCNSTMDGDVGSIMAYLMYKIIDKDFDNVEAEFHLGFDQVSNAGHGYGDFNFAELMAYIDKDVKG